MSGGAGNDFLVGGSGEGNDLYDGGEDIDTVSYVSATQGITVDLDAGTASGAEIDNDIIVNVENIIGGSGGDTIRGDDNVNSLSGGDGDDLLDGGAGADVLLGGAGNDSVVFDAQDDLAALDGGSGIDTLIVNGGSIPALDLAARNFEGADHVLVDSGLEDWQERTDSYSQDWILSSQKGTYDDGRTWDSEWDIADEFDWSQREQYFDDQGRLYEKTETLDNGQLNVTDFDVAGTEVWARQFTSQDVGDNYSWSTNSLRFDDLNRLYEQVGTYDSGRTWQTNWDVTGAEVWSRQFSQEDVTDTASWSTLVLRFDDLDRLYQQTGTYDDGRTFDIRVDLDGTEVWHKQITQQDVADTVVWNTLTLNYDALDRLYEKTETRDNGISYTIKLDVDGTEIWDRQIVTEDLADDHSWDSKTNSYDDQGRVFEQTGTYDDGRTWQTRWDNDGTEVWSREMTTFDVSDTIFYTEITNRYDDQNRLFEQTGVYDDGRTWQTVWDLEDTETWHQQRHIYDTADNHSWSEQIYEYDQSGNVINVVVVDDVIS